MQRKSNQFCKGTFSVATEYVSIRNLNRIVLLLGYVCKILPWLNSKTIISCLAWQCNTYKYNVLYRCTHILLYLCLKLLYTLHTLWNVHTTQAQTYQLCCQISNNNTVSGLNIVDTQNSEFYHLFWILIVEILILAFHIESYVSYWPFIECI